MLYLFQCSEMFDNDTNPVTSLKEIINAFCYLILLENPTYNIYLTAFCKNMKTRSVASIKGVADLKIVFEKHFEIT